MQPQGDVQAPKASQNQEVSGTHIHSAGFDWLYHFIRKTLVRAALGRPQSISRRVFTMMPIASIIVATGVGIFAMNVVQKGVSDTMFIGIISLAVGSSVAYTAITLALTHHQRAMVEAFYEQAMRAGVITYIGQNEIEGRATLRKSIAMSLGVRQGAAAATVVTVMSLGLIGAALGVVANGGWRVGILGAFVTWTWFTFRSLRSGADFVALTPFIWELHNWLSERHAPSKCKICGRDRPQSPEPST